MKLHHLFEVDKMEDAPLVIKMAQKLIDKQQPVYLLRFTSRGEEACRIYHIKYAADKHGGEIELTICVIDEEGDLSQRDIFLNHGPNLDSVTKFDSEWTIITIEGHKIMVRRRDVEKANNLKDEIQYCG